MKKLNAILLTCLSIGLSTLQLYAETTALKTGFWDRLESQAKCLKKMTTKPEIGPGFSFINKFNKPVTITLISESLPKPGGLLNRFKTPSITHVVPTGHIFDATIDTVTPTELKVEYTDSNNKKIAQNYKFAINKTIYVTFAQPSKNPSTILYPQTGPLDGKLEATEQCYALAHNIKQSDISLKK